MVFSSVIFLFGFLPLTLWAYYLSPKRMKNSILLIGSFFFYSWGETYYVFIMVASVIANYLAGLLIHSADIIETKLLPKKICLAMGVIVNLSLLGTFKYANFLVDQLNWVLQGLSKPPILVAPVHLPIGISFFTFQAISYLVDVYRKDAGVQRNIFHLALYISLFPQLIAGPIIRYRDIAEQIVQRHVSRPLFAYAIQRFVFGLAKKMLIANPLGEMADKIFALPPEALAPSLAWPGIIAYTLQIYFDFSGYSDMAIGLGAMFGFKFKENFNYPYMATSIREFWKRWHISLSTWFRDYLYIPLGGNRCSTVRIYVNLFIVFFLCGLWHGASWNFVLWGMIHGSFIVIERVGFDNTLNRIWRPVQMIYTLTIVMVGWVFFRSDTLAFALNYLGVMFRPFAFSNPYYPLDLYLNHEIVLAFCFGSIFCFPAHRIIKNRAMLQSDTQTVEPTVFYNFSITIVLSTLLFLTMLKVSSSTYNPFIYFRF